METKRSQSESDAARHTLFQTIVHGLWWIHGKRRSRTHINRDGTPSCRNIQEFPSLAKKFKLFIWFACIRLAVVVQILSFPVEIWAPGSRPITLAFSQTSVLWS
ncbi:hypothetical protein OUZ56_022249 [Daphnia magna]|uniref:Uncharacterized protein n=1 Tax=Daphnia magna TaxID=35525 RepID=A0ABR0AVX7_9CRUS|nr:hypothetical protein OUZ56_022249 [Daphnia magna]